ncbi:MAG: zinc carboxypeptidase [Phaeodactylibacter sp.]|nr:zinc carboxypeptidase [Phaeodactylibacter sp.]
MAMRYLFLLTLFFAFSALPAQKQPLTYYLPDIDYDPAIPTPESVFGFQPGAWHLSHDQLLYYMRLLADASPRVTLTEYARSYENRPLVYLTITSPANHERLETIRQGHIVLSNPVHSRKARLDGMPVVLYQGFSIHGNEASGGNAAPLVAYYLAAGNSSEVLRTLDEAVILLDPCFNPDGFQRFSTWVNMHRNANLTDDPQDREYHEAWPGGRTNHYWFDLNRDWLPAQHPESQGRLRVFHEWKPNVLTDHHEMGANSTFFFMPGVPERTNPITPAENQALTARIGAFHAEALNEIGSLYYTEEGYDDFYYGKGSTYPDANGGVGILFEQASSRGHLQATKNGPLSFAFTIRNQVRTALSTQKACLAMRTELLDYQRDFYLSALEEARASERKAFVFGTPYDATRLGEMVEILRRHQIEVFNLGKSVLADGTRFEPGQACVVPLEQAQYRLIRGIFDTSTVFQDSIFYDISSWSLPLAFDIPYAALTGKNYSAALLGPPVQGLRPEVQTFKPGHSDYAYLIAWDDHDAPRALNFLMAKGLRAKVATKAFTIEGMRYSPGTILIPVANQDKTPEQLFQLVGEASGLAGVPIIPLQTGFSPEGPSLGSPHFEALQRPRVLLLVGDGVSAYEAGEAWHLLDQRYGIVVSQIELASVAGSDLGKYNTIIMPSGTYRSMTAAGWEKLKSWVKEGGTLIAQRNAIRVVQQHGLAQVVLRKEAAGAEKGHRRPYAAMEPDRDAREVGGAIMIMQADLSHPLFFGYHQAFIPTFRQGNLLVEPAQNPYATPALYTPEPLASGYIKQENLDLLRGSAAVVVAGLGSGRVICLADDPNFRAFWYGGNRLFANCLFFGPVIDRGALERGAAGVAPGG